ncbi:MAG: glycosyltransferase, partial [Candidatus Eremiobacterota bacterium]
TRLVLSRAAHVFANGEFLAERTRALAPRARVDNLYLGVDTERFRPVEKGLSPVRFLCARGFMPVYNNEYIVQALARLPEGLPPFEFVFTAPGPTLDPVRSLADRSLPVSTRERVSFLGGVSDREVVEWLGRCHYFLSTSRSDGTAISLLEALAAGLFPVLSDIPQNRPWAGHGRLVPLEQPEVLAAQLRDLILDPRCWRDNVDANRALILEHADGRRNAGRLARTLERISAAAAP